MRAKDFCRSLAHESGFTVAQSEKFYRTLCHLMEDRLLAGDEVMFRNLFSVRVSDTPARTVKCTFDDKTYHLPPRKTISYRTSDIFRAKLAGKY